MGMRAPSDSRTNSAPSSPPSGSKPTSGGSSAPTAGPIVEGAVVRVSASSACGARGAWAMRCM
eukprot:3609981-Prymnesium_polylepis.1